MKNYESPLATLVALKTDVILTSVVSLTEGGSVSITSLKTFNWNN